jgi:hypothetical protein
MRLDTNRASAMQSTFMRNTDTSNTVFISSKRPPFQFQKPVKPRVHMAADLIPNAAPVSPTYIQKIGKINDPKYTTKSTPNKIPTTANPAV